MGVWANAARVTLQTATAVETTPLIRLRFAPAGIWGTSR